jgi:Mg/Co/Ni transporter MgtE
VSAVLERVSRELTARHPEVAASVLDRIEPQAAGELLRALDGQGAAALLARMSPDAAALVLDDMTDAEARPVLEAADFVRVATIGAQLSTERQERLFSLLRAEERGRVREALEYPAGSAGELMDPKVSTFRTDSTIAEAIERLRRTQQHGLRDLLIVDDEGRLTGTVPTVELLLAGSDQRIAELALGAPPNVGSLATRDEVVEIFRRRPLAIITVVYV